MTKTCGFCFMTIAPAEPKAIIEGSVGTIKYFHQRKGCYDDYLQRTYTDFAKWHRDNQLPPNLLPSKFIDHLQARDDLQKATNHLLVNQPPEQHPLLLQLLLTVEKDLLFTLAIDESLRQVITQLPTPPPKVIAEPPKSVAIRPYSLGNPPPPQHRTVIKTTFTPTSKKSKPVPYAPVMPPTPPVTKKLLPDNYFYPMTILGWIYPQIKIIGQKGFRPIILPSGYITPLSLLSPFNLAIYSFWPPRPLAPPINIPKEDMSEKDLRITQSIISQMRTDMLAITQKPFSLIISRETEVAGTDCLSQIHFNPAPFEQGKIDLGYGTGYHEAGHIKYSSKLYDAKLKAGDEITGHIVNLIMDRHDDYLNAKDAPGFSDTLRLRLKEYFPGHRGRNPWEDFAFACKKWTRPRFPASVQAMKIVKKLHREESWNTQAVVEAAQKIRDILSKDLPPIKQYQQEEGFMLYMRGIDQIERGPRLTPKQIQQIKQLQKNILQVERKDELGALQKFLAQAKKNQGNQPCSIPPHQLNLTKTEIIKPSKDAGKYQEVLSNINNHVNALRNALERIDSPVESTVRFQEEGELDHLNLSRLVLGFKDCFETTVMERDLDVEIHLALDQSGSMMGKKINYARQLGVLFNEAILSKKTFIDGHIWGYYSNDQAIIYDYGSCTKNNPVVTAQADGGNADWEMLSIIAKNLAKSRRQQKVIIVVGDDGPSDSQKVNQLATKLAGHGIPTIHIMVGVFAAPKIYPVELLFQDFPELIQNFGKILLTILK